MNLRNLLGVALLSCGWLVAGAGLGAQEPATGDKPAAAAPSLEPGWLGPFSFRNIGPALMAGRIADIAIDPQHPQTWYLGVGSGGVWKTTNSGTTWTPIFDSQKVYSIGCVSLDPSDCNTVWVGTGENVAGRHVAIGDGVYVSRDGGKNWEHKGLKDSEHISKLWIDPRDSQVILAAAQGPLWSEGGERGIFKSTDGGATWRQVLGKGPYTGATDIVADPENPDVLYAALHQRHRTVWALLDTGPESGIYKSTDGGETWSPLGNGLPGGDKGKIALGVSPQKPNIVYATIELPDRKGGFWRSEDRGASWSKLSDFVSGGTGPHYYQEIYLDPHRFDVIYHANNILMRSEDGGRNWKAIEGQHKHVDNHAVVFHPNDPEFLLVGTDGGLYESHDYARSFRFFPNLPLTQFYKIDVDYDVPFYHVVGGTQDNNTQYGPTRTRYVQGIRNSDWSITVGGDGHDNAIDPTNPNLIYGESQQGFIRRFDRQTGHSVDIQPKPAKGEPGLRFNWDSPILISPHQPNRIYIASKQLHRSDDRGESWEAISPDLSRGADRWRLPIMGRVWGIDAGFDLLAMSQYGNITSISESPKVAGLIYVGTDDGLVQVTEDGGKTWRRIERIYGVPEQAFVNDIKADRHDPDTVYVALDHHKTGDYKPYLVRSRDRGKTWESLAGDLPERHLVWRLEQDPVEPQLLFLGTEYGVFVSGDAGSKWHKLSGGMPTISVRDLAIQTREHDLVAATFGRGIYVLDDYSPLREMVKASFAEKPFHLFAPRKTPWFLPADQLGGPKGFQGDDFFAAPNPTFGAVFTVFIKQTEKTLKQIREEAQGKARSEQRDAEVPGWDQLRAEVEQPAERIFLEISDSSGKLLRRIDCPVSAGVHRVNWDMKYSLPTTSFPILALPGTYRVQGKRLWDGQVTLLGDPVEFVLESIVQPSLAASSADEQRAFHERAAKAQISLMEATAQFARLEKELAGRAELIAEHATDLQSLETLARKAQRRLGALKRKMSGDELQAGRFVEHVPGCAQRVAEAIFSSAGSLHGPTKTHRQQLEIGEQELTELLGELQQLEQGEVADLRNQMNSAGLNWVPPADGSQFLPPRD